MVSKINVKIEIDFENYEIKNNMEMLIDSKKVKMFVETLQEKIQDLMSNYKMEE